MVVVEGTKVTLTLSPKDVGGWMSAHIHRGTAGTIGKLVAEFPWSTGDSSPRASVASVSSKVAAGLVASPGKYYVDVHTPGFPAGAARGQLVARATAEAPPVPIPAAAAEEAPQAPPRATGKAQSIVFRRVSPRVYRDSDFRLDASATSGLSVSFTATGDCTVDGSTVHILSAGKCWVTARQSGDSRFEAAPDVEQLIPIAKADQTIDFPKLWYAYYSPYDLPLYARASSDLQVVFSASGPCSVVGSYLRMAGYGDCLVTADQPGDRNFNPAPSMTRTLEIILQPPPP